MADSEKVGMSTQASAGLAGAMKGDGHTQAGSQGRPESMLKPKSERQAEGARILAEYEREAQAA